jgi:hypothetical protein
MKEKKNPVKPVRASKTVKKPAKVAKVAPVKKQNHDADFEYICQEVEKGVALRKACPVFMSTRTFFELLEASEDKQKRYARACEARADAIFEDILEIADNSGNDTINIDGLDVVNHEAIQRDKLRVDARKWALSKMQPKKYGDKIEVDANVNAKVSTTVINLGSGVDPNETTS